MQLHLCLSLFKSKTCFFVYFSESTIVFSQWLWSHYFLHAIVGSNISLIFKVRNFNIDHLIWRQLFFHCNLDWNRKKKYKMKVWVNVLWYFAEQNHFRDIILPKTHFSEEVGLACPQLLNLEPLHWKVLGKCKLTAHCQLDLSAVLYFCSEH